MREMTANDLKVAMIADELAEASQTHVCLDPLTQTYPDLSLLDAYGIQLTNVSRRLSMGEKISGKKIGLTSRSMQDLLGVHEPDYGHLFDTMEIKNGIVPAHHLIQAKVEAEIAFVLKEDLIGPNVTVEDVLKATDYVVAALEIVDSRIKDWKIKLIDTVSDNASCGVYVLSDHRVTLDKIDLINESMSLYKNGEFVNQGTGKAVLDNPAYCVAWLANKMSDMGVILKKGEVILSGALSAMVSAQAGDEFEARFSTLGSVKVRFE